MTIVVNNPITKRLVSVFLLIIVVILAVAVPATMYWAIQRSDLHRNWDMEARFSQEFLFHTDYATGLLNGNIPGSNWNNFTVQQVSNELFYATLSINGLSTLDTAHGNQLYRISYAIDTIETSIATMNFSARQTFASQIGLLGHKIANAYWNFINYTSDGVGVGPPFWYSGPAPPDENLLQAAVNIAISFQRGP